MGISRDSRHKRRSTGAKVAGWRKKRKYEMGRQPSNTRLGGDKVTTVRVRGGNIKRRALRLETGNFSWGTECITRKTRILDVVYNASNNELVRTKTLVKNAIVTIDATPFISWHSQFYGVFVGKGSQNPDDGKSGKVVRRHEERREGHRITNALRDQFQTGTLLACLTSRPGQSGRADGYILEGKELEFYQRKMVRKR